MEQRDQKQNEWNRIKHGADSSWGPVTLIHSWWTESDVSYNSEFKEQTWREIENILYWNYINNKEKKLLESLDQTANFAMIAL